MKSILNTAGNYIKNIPNKNEIPEEVLEPTLEIIKKYVKLHDRNEPLMREVLDLATLLNTEHLKPIIEELVLIKSMNNNLIQFKGDHDYTKKLYDLIPESNKLQDSRFGYYVIKTYEWWPSKETIFNWRSIWWNCS